MRPQPKDPAEVPAFSPFARLRAHLDSVHALAHASQHVFASPLGPFSYAGEAAFVPRFAFFGPHASDESWRLAFFAGVNGSDVRAARSLLTLVEFLAGAAEEAHGLHLAFFPIVDAAGVFLGAPYRGLAAYHWGRDQVPELALLARDARLNGYHGFVRLETSSAGDDVITVQINNPGPESHTPDLEFVTSDSDHDMPVRFEAGTATANCLAGPMSIAEDLPRAPFELVIRLPGAWPSARYEWSALRILLRFIWGYRAFQAYGQHL